ncbi:unnamed protein product [Phytomonas sp. EM1]|nr:unnamed protein product [Phytomonas sp. EM1]|eukprot:CCW64717.1 unnamed protein product [Phytomonas sp. isolate EM1]
MSGIKGGVGSFLLRRSAPKSIRQRHLTGPQFNKRKFFNFPKGHHRLYRRVAPMMQLTASPTHQLEHERFAHLPGDVRRRPAEDFTFSPRVDRALYAWEKRGGLQLYQMGGKKEIFVCYRCGYPVSSRLVAIREDNWDYRMCYNCYTSVMVKGMENLV